MNFLDRLKKHMKVNPDKCHLLVTTNEKLLRIKFDRKVSFVTTA